MRLVTGNQCNSRQAKTLKETFDGIFCSKLATGLESIIMVQAFRNTRLPK